MYDKENKVKILLRKKLACGIVDLFETIIDINKLDEEKQNYEKLGYEVIVMED